ncbi:MAG: flagellar basal body P-ring formation protein FlgA [Planctomycetales bacterium]|nr:flagellar basal body P-ring formation protein FlgA [Planctomycetales bacterium]
MRASNQETVQRLLLLVACCIAARAASSSGAPPAVETARADLVIVTLRTAALVEPREIVIGDVARVTGGNESLRNRIAALDLDDAPRAGDSMEFTPPQIEFRLRVAGINMDRVAIRGAAVRVTARSTNGERSKITPAVAVSSTSQPESALKRAVTDAAKKCVLARLPWNTEDVRITLTQPLGRELQQADPGGRYSCSAELRSSGPPVGRVQVRVFVETEGRSPLEVPVLLDVRHFDNVVVASKTLERGQPIAKGDLFVDRQEVTALNDYCSSPERLVGTKARRSIQALQLVRHTDIEERGKAETPVLVKRLDVVKLVAKSGILIVTTSGEALQDGRVGERIRVRNVDSKAIVLGRVISATEVEISL